MQPIFSSYYPVSKMSSIIIKHKDDFLMAKMIMEGLSQKNTKIEYYNKKIK